jgi:hypothetical protein
LHGKYEDLSDPEKNLGTYMCCPNFRVAVEEGKGKAYWEETNRNAYEQMDAYNNRALGQ